MLTYALSGSARMLTYAAHAHICSLRQLTYALSGSRMLTYALSGSEDEEAAGRAARVESRFRSYSIYRSVLLLYADVCGRMLTDAGAARVALPLVLYI
jgi:hypothetical protein